MESAGSKRLGSAEQITTLVLAGLVMGGCVANSTRADTNHAVITVLEDQNSDELTVTTSAGESCPGLWVTDSTFLVGAGCIEPGEKIVSVNNVERGEVVTCEGLDERHSHLTASLCGFDEEKSSQ